MTEEKNTGSDGGDNQKAGSPEELVQAGPSTNDGGESAKNAPQSGADGKVDDSKFVPVAQYEGAEQKIGEQGKELGNWRDFYGEVSPLLNKLQERPDIVAAIMDDKISADMATAIADGKFSIKDATEVKDAHDEVKKELGKKDYSKAKPEDIEKMVSEKVESTLTEKTKELKGVISKANDNRDYEDKVNAFIKNTPDYGKYAKDINTWLEEHPDQYDITVAYEAVKGKEVISAAVKEEEAKAAEAAKELAGNAAGGGSQGGKVSEDADLADKLIAGRGNPNVF